MASVGLGIGDLEDSFGATMVRDVFCDNGSGTPGPRLDVSLRVARRVADSILLKAWTVEQIEGLLAEDDAIRSAVLDLALSEGMKGRLQWDFKDGPRETLRRGAVGNLELLVTGQLRSVGEAKVGINPHVSMGRVTTQRTPHSFVFAPSKSKPIRGGF